MRCNALEKTKLRQKKGLWSPDEDQKLREYIVNYGHGCWSAVPINAGLERNGKSCRLRWVNYLRPGLKRGAFSMQEEETILTLHGLLGNKWSLMSQHLPGRTDNEIKNHWHSYLKKRVAKSESLEAQNTNTGNNESSSSYMNSMSRNLSIDSSDSAYSSYVETDQQIPQSQINKLPKILFEDWLNLEEFHGHNRLAFNGGASNNSNYQDTLVDELLSNEAPTESTETPNRESNYQNEDMFHSTQMIIDEIFNFSGGDINIEDFFYM
ncbi:unnamed protein product [Lactuca saligna]|uniref:Uncharacterized protein n=1 Tax=Lactuca saligna TaxID=75948 RepID=A0AA36ENH3_LACSI|nr:unnamed protein product [Lactuca saligna]